MSGKKSVNIPIESWDLSNLNFIAIWYCLLNYSELLKNLDFIDSLYKYNFFLALLLGYLSLYGLPKFLLYLGEKTPLKMKLIKLSLRYKKTFTTIGELCVFLMIAHLAVFITIKSGITLPNELVQLINNLGINI